MPTSAPRKPQILIVDDERDNLSLLRKLLTRHGYHPRLAIGGEIALESIRKTLPDLILLDVLMPRMDGFEVCRHLKDDERTAGIPVIFVTALDDIEQKVEGFRAGGVDYITKPFKAEEVLARVRTHLALKEAEAALRATAREKAEMAAMLNAVFHSVPDTIVAVDRDLRVITANRDLGELCGETGNPADFFRKNSEKRNCECAHALIRALESDESIVDFHIRCEVAGAPRSLVLNRRPLGGGKRRGKNHGIEEDGGAVLVIRDVTRLERLEKDLGETRSFRNIVGKCKAMRKIYALVEQVADLDINVLITGASGTGKELIADALHFGGRRNAGPLVKLNCAALSPHLLESELFGHVRGAFTGAVRDRVGRIEAAEGGTLFLDEIGDLDVGFQAKLLRFLESKEYERLGDSKTRTADVRILAATNRDLASRMREGQFREDLYYRLKGIVIHLPPLKQRTGDVPLLCDRFLRSFRESLGKDIQGISDSAMARLMNHPWPGNIRELRQVLEHACILCPGGMIRPPHLPADMEEAECGALDSDEGEFIYAPKLDRETLVEALERNRWNKTEAARELGISRNTLYRYMAGFKVSRGG